MKKTPKVYFISDLHLGVPDRSNSSLREKLFLQWLDMVSADAAEIYLIGDLFDFWHEYDTVVPKGFVRTLSALAAVVSKGIPVYLFHGNHDMWMGKYLEEETGVTVMNDAIEKTINNKLFMIGHGDGLGPGDHGYKLLKKIFRNPLCRFLFKWIHPDLGTKLAQYLSYKSRFSNGISKKEIFQGNESEWLVQYAHRKLKDKEYDFFIFGHRHLPLHIKLNNKSTYLNTGDWITHFSYVVFDGEECHLRFYKNSADA